MIGTRRGEVARLPEAAWMRAFVARLAIITRGVSLLRVATLHGIGERRALCCALDGRHADVGAVGI